VNVSQAEASLCLTKWQFTSALSFINIHHHLTLLSMRRFWRTEKPLVYLTLYEAPSELDGYSFAIQVSPKHDRIGDTAPSLFDEIANRYTLREYEALANGVSTISWQPENWKIAPKADPDLRVRILLGKARCSEARLWHKLNKQPLFEPVQGSATNNTDWIKHKVEKLLYAGVVFDRDSLVELRRDGMDWRYLLEVALEFAAAMKAEGRFEATWPDRSTRVATMDVRTLCAIENDT
jgi:hypothetical protein